LGPIIAGDEWESIYDRDAQQATTNTMIEFHRKLPSHLTEIQKLTFKPSILLSVDEKSSLIAHFGGEENPLVRYFHQEKAKAKRLHKLFSQLSDLDLDGINTGVGQDVQMNNGTRAKQKLVQLILKFSRLFAPVKFISLDTNVHNVISDPR
jgi:hypothetical protein